MFYRIPKLASALMTLPVLLVLSNCATAQNFFENFDVPTGANGQVVFRADPFYLSTGASPSGGDKNGNRNTLNGFVIPNNNFPPFSPPGTWGLISQDQSGSGYFLYEGTNGTPTVGTFWRTYNPVPVLPDTDYVFSFYLTNSNSKNPAIVQPYINGSPVGGARSAQGYYTDGTAGDGWQQFVFVWNSGSATTADLSLMDLCATPNGNDFGIDTIAFSPVVPVFTEDFDNPTGANGQVVFRADPIYLATGASPSGGDKNGNRNTLNGFVVPNSNFYPFNLWGLINHDQSGSGYFLLEATNGTTPAATLWRTYDPVPVMPDTDYIFSFYLTNLDSKNPAIVQPYINGSPMGRAASAQGYYGDGTAGDGWQQFAVVWNSGSTTTADLSLMNLRATPNGNDFGIDTIAFSSFDPALTSLSPGATNAAGPNFTLKLNGSHFTRSAIVHWTSGTTTTALKTISVSSTQLKATVPASLIVNAGAATVIVANTGESVSNGEPFTILLTTLNLSSAKLMKTRAGNYTAKISLQNVGHLTAPNVMITQATLGTTATGTTLPVSLGSLANGKTVSTTLSFPSTAGSSGTTVTLTVSGTFSGGTFSGSLNVKLP